MSRLKDLVSKGVRLIVADPEAGAEASPTPTAAPSARSPPRRSSTGPAAASERSQVAATSRTSAPSTRRPASSCRSHGYGVDKVAEMLQSKRLATLGREVKATAVLAALEAAAGGRRAT